MNKIIVIPKNFKIPETIRVASESVRANLAKKRAQRGTANALNEVTNPTDWPELDFPMDFTLWESGKTPVNLKAETKIETSVIPKLEEIELSDIDLDFTKWMPTELWDTSASQNVTLPILSEAVKPVALKSNPPITSLKSLPKRKDGNVNERNISLTQTAMLHAEWQRPIIEEIYREKNLDPKLTVDEIVDVVAIMETHEELWDTLQINEINIPATEVSLWWSFMRFFTPTSSERVKNSTFEKWDIFDIKIRGFDMFLLTRIRKSEKNSLTFCVVKSKISTYDPVYVFELLVKLPIREGEILEIFRNRNSGPELINSWPVEQVFLKRQKVDKEKKKNSLLKILGI